MQAEEHQGYPAFGPREVAEYLLEERAYLLTFTLIIDILAGVEQPSHEEQRSYRLESKLKAGSLKPHALQGDPTPHEAWCGIFGNREQADGSGIDQGLVGRLLETLPTSSLQPKQ